MKRAPFLAALLCAAAPLVALDYTVSVRIDPALLNQASGSAILHAELRVAEKTVSAAAAQTLDLTRGLVPVTLTFSDVQTTLSDALIRTPEAPVEIVYFYKSSEGAAPVEAARQTVPSAAYTAVAETVTGAAQNFTVKNTLTAQEITLDPQGSSQLTLSESADHRVETLSCETLAVETLSVQESLAVSGTATLSGPATFRGKLSGLGLPPVGTIILTEQPLEDDRWQLCDGAPVTDAESPFHGKPTPDLRGRFLRGTADFATIGTTGGTESVTLEGKHLPRHTHPYSTVNPVVRTNRFFGISEKDSGGNEWINHEQGNESTQRPNQQGRSDSRSAATPIPLLPPYCVFNFYLRIK